MVTRSTLFVGKRQVKNESALKEIRLPEEGELFGRVLKMMGGENVMIKWMIERINTLNSIRYMYNKRPVAN